MIGDHHSLTGSFTDASGATSQVTGNISADPRAASFTIATATPTTFSGHLNGHQLGVMSGAVTSGAFPVGFYAYRTGAVPSTLIGRPPREAIDPELPVCAKKPYLPNCQ